MKDALMKKYSLFFSAWTCCIIPFLLIKDDGKTTGTFLLQLDLPFALASLGLIELYLFSR